MIDRINNLTIQWLSSLLQRWHPTNICQPGKSCEEAFLYFSFGQADPQWCRVAILDLLRIVYLSMFVFPFESLNCQTYPSHLPYLCNFTFLVLHGSILRNLLQLFLSVQQVSQKSKSGLQARCVQAGSCITDSWTAGRRVTGMTSYSGKKLLTLSYEELSFIVRSCCCEGAESNNTHLIK